MVDPDQSFVVDEDRPAISYGPSRRAADQWMLGFSTETGERVEIEVGKNGMYDLWVEVSDVPWPRTDSEASRLKRELVEKIQRMDEDGLREVSETVDAIWGEPP